MKKLAIITLTGTLALAAGMVTFAQGRSRTVQVYKDPSCGCCVKWVEHLRKAGFTATVTDSDEMTTVKDTHKVPKAARSCHTAVINGFTLEGHVPAADVQRLLKERPAGVIGLSVPGMPIGSPGMEVAGGRVQPFDVLAFDKEGRTSVFASYGR